MITLKCTESIHNKEYETCYAILDNKASSVILNNLAINSNLKPITTLKSSSIKENCIPNKHIIMSSFKSSGDIQKKEGGPDSCFG